MNQLLRTTIVPPNDAESILKNISLKFVILVDDQNLAEMANNMALTEVKNIERSVIWFKKPDWNELLKLFPELTNKPNTLQAFSLSTKNRIADIITTTETVDYARVGLAYSKAGLAELN